MYSRNLPYRLSKVRYTGSVRRPGPLARAIAGSGPLAPGLFFFGAFAAMFLLSRLALIAYFQPPPGGIESYAQILRVGLRIDVIVLSLLVTPPTLALLLLPAAVNRATWPLIATWFTLAAAMLVFIELASAPFLAEYNSRPNYLFFQYVAHPKEVLSTLWADYKAALIITPLAAGAVGLWLWRWLATLVRDAEPWPYWQRLAVLPLVAAALFVGARSGLGEATPNPSLAVFSNDRLANELALNSFYSLAFAVYRQYDNDIDAGALYGRLPREEVLRRVKGTMNVPAAYYVNGELPTLHVQPAAAVVSRPRNLVVIVEESLGADMVGSLGGLPLTPNLDALANQGLYFTNLFAIGPRTNRGLEAMAAGYLPSPSQGTVLKLGQAQHNFFTLAELLRRQGYRTGFIYGGEAHFDNMASFFRGNGFAHIVDQADFTQPVFRSAWGVSDEDLFTKADEIFNRPNVAPFFYLVLTLSNHRPHEFPDGRIELYQQPKAAPANSARYADYALGEFFRRARGRPYFNDTVFVVVADHPMHPTGSDLVPVEQFRIPGLIVAPGVAPRRISTVASQMDLPPTALSLLGIDTTHPMVGRNLLSLPKDDPGRAVIQYHDANAYRSGDQVVIHQPHKPAEQFKVRDGRLLPAPVDPELEKDALAHILLPGLLYREQRYRLPPPQSISTRLTTRVN